MELNLHSTSNQFEPKRTFSPFDLDSNTLTAQPLKGVGPILN